MRDKELQVLRYMIKAQLGNRSMACGAIAKACGLKSGMSALYIINQLRSKGYVTKEDGGAGYRPVLCQDTVHLWVEPVFQLADKVDAMLHECLDAEEVARCTLQS